MNNNSKNDLNHKIKMQRKKSQIDASIAKSTDIKGLVIVLTGHGKGKSSSAFGMVGRSLGQGLKVGVCQFLKSRTDTGEEHFYSSHKKCEWKVLGDGFTWDTQNRQQDIITSKKAWVIANQMLTNPMFDMVILDELTYLLNYNYLNNDEVIQSIQNRPIMQHVIITGRSAPKVLIDLAHTVSEIKEVKHAYKLGIKSQKGIEF